MRYIYLVILSLALVFTGCQGKGPNSPVASENQQKEDQPEKQVLEIWSHYNDFEETIEQFNKRYPDVEVKVKEIRYKDYVAGYLEALVAGCSADIMLIDSADFSVFSTLDVFEDLSKQPYTAVNYQENFDPELWEIGKSFDQTKLIGLAFASAPIVTYYRADIMEAYGFPSEPEELADFMATPENWLAIGRKLREDGIYIMQQTVDPMNIVGTSMGYFNEHLHFLRDNDTFKTAIDTARAAKESGLVPFIDIWTEEGLSYLKDGRLAMLYLGSWGSSQLEAWVPEQEGLWRATRLPFDTYGWSNSSLLCIPTASNQKALAWEFIEDYVFGTDEKVRLGNVSGYLPRRMNKEAMAITNGFLGGQREQLLYEVVMAKTNEYFISPLDAAAQAIIISTMGEGFETNADTDTIMKEMIRHIEEQLKEEKEILLREKNDQK